MSKDELEDIHSTKMDRHLEKWEVEGTQALLLGLGRRAVLQSRHRIHPALFHRFWPLLFDARESFARNLIHEDAGEKLTAKLNVFHDMERLLQDVQAEWII